MLVLAFVVAGLLEVFGLWFVVRDLGHQRDAALRLIATPPSDPVELNESNVRRFGGSLTRRRDLLQIESDTARASAAGELVRDVLIDLLQPDRSRRSGRFVCSCSLR